MPNTIVNVIQAKAKEFFKINDRFPTYIAVGIDSYNDVLNYYKEQRMFLNRITLNTIFGKRRGIEGTALNVDVIIPSAQIGDYDVGEPEQFTVRSSL
jgi:hypothetical protein